MKDVSIIIVNYHSEQLVLNCIDSVKEKTNGIDYEIIIVDNDTCMESQKKLSEFEEERIKIIYSPENLGFGKANNLAAEQAGGKYLFLLNPDTELLNNAVKILFDYSELHGEVGVVGGNLFSKTGEPTPSYCDRFDSIEDERKASQWNTFLKNRIKRRKKKTTEERLEHNFNFSSDPKKVAYIFGADMLMKKELFDELSGFDKSFFMYGEEEELQKRITDKGYKIMNVPYARIMHLEGGTMQSQSPMNERQFEMRMTGRMTYYHKCFGIEGVHKFHQYRTKKYKRQLLLQRLIRRKENSDTRRSLQIVDKVYENYMRNWEG